MRLLLILSILACFSIFSCTSNKDFNEDFQDSWSLTNVSGGIAGLNCDYELDVIVWSISQALIEVTNNSTPNGLCDNTFPESASYNILENGGDHYLNYNDSPYGLINIEGDNMTINGTFNPDGEVSDAFTYQFSR